MSWVLYVFNLLRLLLIMTNMLKKKFKEIMCMEEYLLEEIDIFDRL